MKNLPIQTHISENKQEIELVDKLFPDCENYASVYNKFNLLTNKTILAHAIHLTPKECQLIKLKNCSISHCPTSNTFYQVVKLQFINIYIMIILMFL